AGYQGSMASVTVTVAKRESALTLTGPAEGTVGAELRFSGELSFGGRTYGYPLSMKVLRTVSRGGRPVTTVLPAVTSSLNGLFSFSDTPPRRGRYTYTVQWAGNDTVLPAEVTHDVTVRGRRG
ncbi:hypothetical protein, partial [Streptosporangium sp. NPDC048865]|uniref:hypothetical protein n=1 Tax=Streptosporangium sp. NPDC048865 TaxID=3155766 RepID=UPI0034468687